MKSGNGGISDSFFGKGPPEISSPTWIVDQPGQPEPPPQRIGFGWSRKLRARLGSLIKIVTIGAAIVLIVIDGVRAVSHASDPDVAFARADFPQHQAAGHAVLEGTNLYEARNRLGAPYTASPIIAVGMVPFALLNEFWGSLLWYVLSVSITVNALWLCRQMARRFWPLPFRRDFWLCVGGCLLVLPPFWNGLRWENLSIVATYALIVSLWLYLENRLCWAGLALAVGVLLKVSPALFLVYFVLKRRFVMVAVTVAWLLVLLVVAPSAVFGWKGNQAYLKHWCLKVCRSAVAPEASQDRVRYVDDFGLGRPNNYSLQAELFRLITGDHGGIHDPSRVWWARLVARLAAVCLFLIGVYVLRHGRAERDQSRTVLEYCFVLILVLVVSPLTWFHYFTLLALPVAVGIWSLVSGIGSDLGRVYGTGLVVYAMAILIGSASGYFLSHGVVTAGVVALGGSFFWALCQVPC